MRAYCIAHRIISNHLWWDMMEDNVRKRIYIYIYVWLCVCVCLCVIWLGHFAVHQKLTEHCKSTITEKIKIFKKKNSKVYEQVKKQDIEESVEYKSYLYNFFKECTHIDLERYPSMLTVVLLGE